MTDSESDPLLSPSVHLGPRCHVTQRQGASLPMWPGMGMACTRKQVMPKTSNNCWAQALHHSCQEPYKLDVRAR
jgi:hypothetical protein